MNYEYDSNNYLKLKDKKLDEMPETKNGNYRLTDLMGHELQSGKLGEENLKRMTMKNYAAGIYLLEIISEEKKWIK